MVGVLVHGDNHLILRGPLPDRQAALRLVRGWALTTIGSAPPGFETWRVVTREFRENLQWAVVVPGETETSPAVKKLLEELSVRGIMIQVYEAGSE